MEIGEFIQAKKTELEAWGAYIVSIVGTAAAGLLKVPASCRVKDVTSARVKQLKKAYSNPTSDMTDLVGARFVVLTSNDLVVVQQAIEQGSFWEHQRTRDPVFEIAKEPTAFGYQSLHYEVRPKIPILLKDIEVNPDICCEIQVRTLLQHAYAELTHDSLYKPDQIVPSHAERLVARSMALMETTDELLCRALEAVNDANRPALALTAAAEEITSSLARQESKTLAQIMAQEFIELVDASAADDLRLFASKHAFVMDRIRSRPDSGLFGFPGAAMIGYWIASKLENSATHRWPLPGSRDEFTQMLTDLGIGQSVK